MLGASAPHMDLQNLAWLGEDGQVHAVNQNNQNGGLPMLGASSPMLVNLNRFTDMRDKVIDSKYVNKENLLKAATVADKGLAVSGKVIKYAAPKVLAAGTKAANFAMSDEGKAIISDEF